MFERISEHTQWDVQRQSVESTSSRQQPPTAAAKINTNSETQMSFQQVAKYADDVGQENNAKQLAINYINRYIYVYVYAYIYISIFVNLEYAFSCSNLVLTFTQS